ncbi:MAG: TIGR02266 family protein [Acidobacteria bacterium]|nr:TIGR02266 family protein [Acidobacteriota bacterium]
MPLETRVQFKFDRFSGFLSDFSANISPGGMFIRTRTPQPPGTVLEFEFRLGDGFELIKGRGEVVWVRPEDEGPARPAGMGLRFLELSLGSKELIYRIVDHHIQQGGTPFDVTQRPSDPVPVPPPVAAPPAVAAPWLPSPRQEPEEPGGFDPSPYEPSRDDWMKAREPLPAEPLPGFPPGGPEPEATPVPVDDDPAAAPLFASTLAGGPPPRTRRALPWVLLAVLVGLAAGAWLFRDTLFGLAGLGGGNEVAQASPPAVRRRPGRLRTPALPVASPAATPASAPPLDTAGAPAGPETEVSPVRPAPPAATPAPPAPVAQTTPASPRPGPKPQSEKPAPVPAIPEDNGPAATGVEKITFEKAFGGTDVILWGNGAIHSGSYVRTRIDGNPPRELIRISGIRRPAPAARLVVGTPEVLQVRTGLHAGDELHVVLDLAGPKVTVTRVEEGENRLRIHLQKQ